MDMYDRNQTEASKGAIVELALAMESYSDDYVLVGGWVPYFLTQGFASHCGSIDIDLVLRTNVMTRYESIRRLIHSLGYHSTTNAFRFERIIRALDGTPFAIHLDFLTEPEGEKHVTSLLKVQESLEAVFIPGCNIVFRFNQERSVRGVMPAGGEGTAKIRMADIVGALTMKGLALGRATKIEKDAYDIYLLAGFHMGSPDRAAARFNQRVDTVNDGIMPDYTQQALQKISDAFESPNSYGPLAVSHFIEEDVSVDASERVRTFLSQIERANSY